MYVIYTYVSMLYESIILFIADTDSPASHFWQVIPAMPFYNLQWTFSMERSDVHAFIAGLQEAATSIA